MSHNRGNSALSQAIQHIQKRKKAGKRPRGMIEIKPEYAAAMAGGMKVMEYASMRNFQSIDNDELIR